MSSAPTNAREGPGSRRRAGCDAKVRDRIYADRWQTDCKRVLASLEDSRARKLSKERKLPHRYGVGASSAEHIEQHHALPACALDRGERENVLERDARQARAPVILLLFFGAVTNQVVAVATAVVVVAVVHRPAVGGAARRAGRRWRWPRR